MRDDRAVADEIVTQVIQMVAGRAANAAVYARLLTGPDCPVPPDVAATSLRAWIQDRLALVCANGWTPADLDQVTRRRLDEGHLPMLVALVRAETDRHDPDLVAAAWRAELGRLGEPQPADLRRFRDVARALALAALLLGLPRVAEILPAPGSLATRRARRVPRKHGAQQRPTDQRDESRLARVRALLAKAESTAYAEEAEALTAKAQEIISRYALERLLAAADHRDDDGIEVRARRIWIDQPYVYPKALLVDVVARANRCRTVIAESLGVTTVVGEPADIDVVELMATSLMVQASAAMLGHGRSRTGSGGGTTAFRRSFLVAYAGRIGERLDDADSAAAAQTGRAAELVPIVQQHDERVEARVGELFPNLRTRRTTVSSREGWVAGRAAADRAELA